MTEPVPFRTGRDLSTADFGVITAGLNATTVAALGYKNKKWSITDSSLGANIPANPYRSSVVVDNSQGGAVAWLVAGDTIANVGDNPAYTLGWVSVPVGSVVTFSRENLLSGTGVMSVMIESSAGTTVVSELSFV